LTTSSLLAKIAGVSRGMIVEWSVKALRDVRRLAPTDRQRIVAKIERYAEDTDSLARQVTTLSGSNYKRLRVGSHRVIFSIERAEDARMIILRVRHRREAYDS